MIYADQTLASRGSWAHCNRQAEQGSGQGPWLHQDYCGPQEDVEEAQHAVSLALPVGVTLPISVTAAVPVPVPVLVPMLVPVPVTVTVTAVLGDLRVCADTWPWAWWGMGWGYCFAFSSGLSVHGEGKHALIASGTA